MEDSLNLKFAALSDPTRRAILARLALGEATVGELAQPFRMSQPAVSKHLRILETAGLIEAGRAAQARPRRLRQEGLRETEVWIGQLHAMWDESFDRLDAFLEQEKGEGE